MHGGAVVWGGGEVDLKRQPSVVGRKGLSSTTAPGQPNFSACDPSIEEEQQQRLGIETDTYGIMGELKRHAAHLGSATAHSSHLDQREILPNPDHGSIITIR